MDNYGSETIFDIDYLYDCHCTAAVCSRIIAFIVASAHLKSAMLKFVVDNCDLGRAEANQVKIMAWAKGIPLGGQYFFIVFNDLFSLVNCNCFALCTYKASSGEIIIIIIIMISCLH